MLLNRYPYLDSKMDWLKTEQIFVAIIKEKNWMKQDEFVHQDAETFYSG